MCLPLDAYMIKTGSLFWVRDSMCSDGVLMREVFSGLKALNDELSSPQKQQL